MPPHQHFLNTGAAFGILPGWRWPLAAIGVLALPLVYAAARELEGGRLAAWSAGLVAGGAVTNTLDRLVRGGVVDFLAVPGYPFRFNVADVALRLGILLFLYAWLRTGQRRAGTSPTPRSET